MAKCIEHDKIYEVLNSLLNDIMDSTDTSVEFDNGWEAALRCANDRINDIPVADVRPERHGHWVYHHDIHGISYICSNCNCGVSDTDTEHYCHYCGAKMDGKDGENNGI